MRIGIVGAGMAGLACAEALSIPGHDVVLFDKGRGPGGRMSTRRLPTSAGEAQFDHGAQYFTVRDDGFRRRVDGWIAQGVVAPWPAAGHDAYVGVPGMNAPIKQMADGLTVHWGMRVTQIERSGRGWRMALEQGDVVDLDIAVVATPAEQASALVDAVAPDLAARARSTPSAPCWTVMFAFAEPLPTEVDCLRGAEGDPLGWAARNDADAEWVSATLSAALSERLGTAPPSPIAHSTHRWRYARASVEGSGALWDKDQRLGLCGDWLIGARVEAAWRSGTQLAERIKASAP
jgi:predicted NAD/FAD-dependent oxidoreductase